MKRKRLRARGQTIDKPWPNREKWNPLFETGHGDFLCRHTCLISVHLYNIMFFIGKLPMFLQKLEQLWCGTQSRGFSRAGPRGRGREWATLGVHPLSWLLSNNRLEEVCGTLTKGAFSNWLLLSNQDKGCTPSVAHSLPLPLPPGFCSTCQGVGLTPQWPNTNAAMLETFTFNVTFWYLLISYLCFISEDTSTTHMAMTALTLLTICSALKAYFVSAKTPLIPPALQKLILKTKGM